MGYLLSGSPDSSAWGSKTFFKYNPVEDSWEQLNDYPGPNRGLGMGTQYEGKAYFGFGNDASLSYLNDFWEYDPQTDTFTELPSCGCLPRFHPAIVGHNGKIYVGMGDNDTGDLDDWWSYDIQTQQWEQKESIPGIRHHPYFFSIGEYIYVGGGHDSNWYQYNPIEDDWSLIVSLDDRVAGTQFSFNGKGYALSGTSTNHGTFSTGEFWEYDPIADSWTELDPHPGKSKWAPASFSIDDYAYIMTGKFDDDDSNSMYRYKFDAPTSTTSLDKEDNNFNVYPNPFLDKLSIDTKLIAQNRFYVKVYNATGRIVYNSEKLISANEINLVFLPKGIYMLVLSNEQVYSKKIIKN